MPPSNIFTGNRRYLTAVACFIITTICYSDRTNIGIAIPAFVNSKLEQGEVLSAFFYGYLITQLPGGFLATAFGAKRVLLTGVVVWSLFDMSTVLFSKCFTCLFLVRAGMGLGEGILFPCMHQISGAWFPLQERSRLVSFISSGCDVGTILALAISPAIMTDFGWQFIFLFFGFLSFCWVSFYVFFGVSKPEQDRSITESEKAYILSNRTIHALEKSSQRHHGIDLDDDFSSHSSSENMFQDWSILLTSRPAWAIYVAHFCNNYGWYVLLGWVPQYFSQVLKIDLGKHGFVAAIPYIFGYIGVLFFGRLGDKLVNTGMRVLHVRQIMNGIGLFGSAVFLFILRLVPSSSSIVLPVALLSLTLFFGRASAGGYWVNMIDIGPSHAAEVMAVSNTIATIPGILGNVITGEILARTGRWDIVFAVASAVFAFGGFFFHFNASDKCIFQAKRRQWRKDLTGESESLLDN